MLERSSNLKERLAEGKNSIGAWLTILKSSRCGNLGWGRL